MAYFTFNVLLDAVVAALQSNADLVALLNNNDPTQIYPHYYGQPGPTDLNTTSMNFEQRVQEQPQGTILVSWRGSQIRTRGVMDVTAHFFAAYLKPNAYIADAFAAFKYGVCTSTGSKFYLSEIHPKCDLPRDIELTPTQMVIGAAYMIYEMMPVTFTLTERGLDVEYQ